MLRGMFQILSIDAAEAVAVPGGEAAARIAGLRRALRLLEPSGGGPSCDEEEFELDFANDAVRRCFDARSERVIGAAAAGLEAVVGVRDCGAEAHPVAVDLVADAIREGLADLSELLRR